MAKQTQKERAQKYLERNPKIEELYGTSDGFNFEKPQDALSHSTTLENKELTVFKADGKAEKVDFKETTTAKPAFLKTSVKKIEEALPQIKDVKTLTGYLEFEQATEQPRSTAIKAIEARIEALTSAE